jgi:type III restriction enzyme
VEAREKEGAYTVTLDEADIELPDLLTDLQDRTQLTRRTLVKILTECERLDDFKRNPQQFIEQAAEIINRCKRMALVDGIRYQRLGDDVVWAQELFETEELTGYLTNMLRDTKRSIYEHVVYDSATERDFADALEKDDDVVLYAKLPGWFKVPTPLGNYNPDWAVLVNKDGTHSACTSWSRPRAACSPTTCATRRAPRSSAARRTSRRWPSATTRRATWWRGRSVT